jgi:gliding motility-associated-like protein
VKIGEVSRNTLTFTDNNAGAGLKRGINYCYRLVAIFPSPSLGESYASNEMCASLALDAPLITKVSVLETAENGKMQVEWTQPLELDKTQFPAPYRYRLFRAESLNGNNFTQVYETNTLTDTTFTDVVDTRNKEYTYKLAFYSGASAQLRDSADAASSVQLIPEASVGKVQLRWTANVPWSNLGYQHYIFRKVNGSFALIDSVLSASNLVNYTDNGTYLGIPLEPSVVYTYKVRTQGKYTSDRMPKTLFNDSYEVLAIPRDTVAPCPPVLSLDSANCGNTAPCDTVITQYKVYFTPYEGDSMQLLATVTDTFFVHNNLNSLAGCYYVTALDAFGNESKPSNIACKDNCVALEFPNVFTVNGDAKNQTFRPICITPSYIKSIRFSIYNRWGKKIYETDDKENLFWDGTIKEKPAVTGTYFYLAEVEFIRLRRGQERKNYKGWLDLLR